MGAILEQNGYRIHEINLTNCRASTVGYNPLHCMADIKAHAKGTQKSRIERCLALGTILDEVIVEEQCFSMKDVE